MHDTGPALAALTYLNVRWRRLPPLAAAAPAASLQSRADAGRRPTTDTRFCQVDVTTGRHRASVVWVGLWVGLPTGEIEKSGYMAGTRSFLRDRRNENNPLKSVAGAGGIEPPNGGIKIRCLTAWLRPNRPERGRGSTRSIASGNARSIEGVAPFQQAGRPNFVQNQAPLRDPLYRCPPRMPPGRFHAPPARPNTAIGELRAPRFRGKTAAADSRKSEISS